MVVKSIRYHALRQNRNRYRDELQVEVIIQPASQIIQPASQIDDNPLSSSTTFVWPMDLTPGSLERAIASIAARITRNLIIQLSVEYGTRTPIPLFREHDTEWLVRFGEWNESLPSTKLFDDLIEWQTAIEIFGRSRANYLTRLARLREGSILLEGWEGAGRAISFRGPMTRGLLDADTTGTFVVQRESDLLSEVSTEPSTITRKNVTCHWAGVRGAAAKVATIRTFLGSELLVDLALTFGEEDPLCQLRDLGPEALDNLVSYLRNQSYDLQSVVKWEETLQAVTAITSGGMCISAGFNSGWGLDIAEKILFSATGGTGGVLYALRTAVENRNRRNISAIDVADFARESLPANSAVQSATRLYNGRLRIVLREPVRAVAVQRLGHIYVEEVPGTVLTDMVIAAFELDFAHSGNQQFPNAFAYEDVECTRAARHTNILPGSGSVCLGDLNFSGTSPTISDFLQMMRMCNLDSPYNSAREFIFRNPGCITLEAFRGAVPWNIPGLRLLEQDARLNPRRPQR
jgi:hypothetical protein